MPQDTFYFGAPPSQTVGNLTQRTSGTYTATQFIPGSRNLAQDSPGEERVIPIALQYTIPKGTGMTSASQMMNAILTSKEKPQISLVGGNPERVRVEWYEQCNTLVNVTDTGSLVEARPEVDDVMYRQMNLSLKMIGNAAAASYTPLKPSGSYTVCQSLCTFRKHPAIFYDLDSTRPLNIPVPRNLDPIITVKGAIPTGDENLLDKDIIISVFYGVIVCDSAALSSSLASPGIEPIGGFWDWAAKVLKIVVKVVDVVLPIIESLADPKAPTPGTGDAALIFATSHPEWHKLSVQDRDLWILRIRGLLSSINTLSTVVAKNRALRQLTQRTKTSAVKRRAPSGQNSRSGPVSAPQKRKRLTARSN